MRLDIDLLRHLLFEIEESDIPGEYTALKLENAVKGFENKYGDNFEFVKNEHLYLLHEAKYVEAIVMDRADGYKMVIVVKRTTWEGHNYLNSIRSSDVWSEIKTKIKSAGSYTIPVIQQIAASLILKKTGLG